MPKAYWIGRINVSDPDKYQKYVEANAPAFVKYGARFIVRGGTPTALEGEARQRNVVIEFPDRESAIACWNSPEYQAARAHREGAAEVDLIVIEGYEGPQPG